MYNIIHIKRVYQCLRYFIMVKHIIKMHQSQLLGFFFSTSNKKKKKQTNKQTQGVFSSNGKNQKVAIASVDLEGLV